MPDLNAILGQISLMALPFLLAVTLHEAGHAFAADALGDKTPRAMGRLSLNPLKHIDPFGTVFLPLMAIFAGAPFLFGYAKPVMVRMGDLRHGRAGRVFVSLAGPLGNLIVAIFCAYMVRFGDLFGADPQGWLITTMTFGIIFNAFIMVINLMPIPPLDGGHIIQEFLPYEAAQAFAQVGRFGIFILLGIFIFVPQILIYPAFAVANAVAWLVDVPLL